MILVWGDVNRHDTCRGDVNRHDTCRGDINSFALNRKDKPTPTLYMIQHGVFKYINDFLKTFN